MYQLKEIETTYMATTNDVRMKSEQLLQEVGIWRQFVASPHDQFTKDPMLKDFFSFKVDIAQGYIEESQSWEKSGNETKCRNAIDNAELFIEQIQMLFNSMFVDQDQGTWQDMEEERNSPDYVHVS